MDQDYFTKGTNDSPPLGLVVIQNHLYQVFQKSIKVDIVDGEYNSIEHIEDSIVNNEYDIIGIQPMMASYKNTLRILHKAKQRNVTTVLGGHHATQLADVIISNRKNIVDYIIVGDGEEALSGLIEGLPQEQIPNLVYYDQDENEICHTFSKNTDIDLEIIEGFDPKILTQYMNVKDKCLEREKPLTSFRAFSHKGCANRDKSQYCYFCGRADKGVRFKTPDQYIRELKYLSEIPNVRYIFEIGDDFLQDHEWLMRVCDLKEKEIPNNSIHLKIFSRANRITPRIINFLKRLSVDEVAIGFESGSEEILRTINKNATAEDNIRAAELLFSNGIDTIASFVLGLPGENDRTLKETYDQAMHIHELSFKYLKRKPQEIIANLIEINPGSLAYKNLMHHMPEKYEFNDMISVKEAQDDYFRVTFNLETDRSLVDLRKKLSLWGKKINRLGLYTYPAGWQKTDMEDINATTAYI